MNSAVNNILNRIFVNQDHIINIITNPVDKNYQSGLANINANFWIVENAAHKDIIKYMGSPKNHHYLTRSSGFGITFDLIMCQSLDWIEEAVEISKKLCIPIIRHERFFPIASITEEQRKAILKINTSLNNQCFSSESCAKAWSQNGPNTIIEDVINEKIFAKIKIEKVYDIFCYQNNISMISKGTQYSLYLNITNGFSSNLFGSNRNSISGDVKNVVDLCVMINSASIFLDVTTEEKINPVLLQAMSCGACCVAYNNGENSKLITDGVNGFLYNTVEEARAKIKTILADEYTIIKVGEKASEITSHIKKNKEVLEKFLMQSAQKNYWEKIR